MHAPDELFGMCSYDYLSFIYAYLYPILCEVDVGSLPCFFFDLALAC
jgi:hypothetical protein